MKETLQNLIRSSLCRAVAVFNLMRLISDGGRIIHAKMGSKTLATQLKDTLLQKDADIDGFLDEEETGLMYASRNCAN